jgi:hypothetical protein
MTERLKCTFTYSWRGKIGCDYPRGECLLQKLQAEGTDPYLHHGQLVEGDCAKKAAEPGYTPHESRGDPR